LSVVARAQIETHKRTEKQMRVPVASPARPARSDQLTLGPMVLASALQAQGLFDGWFPDPTKLKCIACCHHKAGFLACVARCVATGQACDGGVDNCTSC
jgi:hypothetical protein